MYEEYIGPIADISHYRHYKRYHTFFKPGYILAQSAREAFKNVLAEFVR